MQKKFLLLATFLLGGVVIALVMAPQSANATEQLMRCISDPGEPYGGIDLYVDFDKGKVRLLQEVLVSQEITDNYIKIVADNGSTFRYQDIRIDRIAGSFTFSFRRTLSNSEAAQIGHYGYGHCVLNPKKAF